MRIIWRGNQGCACDIPGGVTQMWEDAGRPCPLDQFECPQCGGDGLGYDVEEWVDGSLRRKSVSTREEAEEMEEEAYE